MGLSSVGVNKNRGRSIMDTIVQIILYLSIWCAISTALLLVAKRDVLLGLKKWFFLRTKRQPLKIRYHGADQNVQEIIVTLKGKGETIDMFDRKLLIIKTGKGQTFIIDPKAIRRTDDGVNEISYTHKSIMPIDPIITQEEIQLERSEFVRRIQEEKKVQDDKFVAVELDNLVRYTDPKRLNKLIEYIRLAAKADALAAATAVEKWIKITAIIAGVSVLIGIATYYELDTKVLPLLQTVAGQIAATLTQTI